MNSTRKVKIVICLLATIAVVSLGFIGYLLFQNYWWKFEAKRYAESSARLEAQGMFRHGSLCLFKMDGQCDEVHNSGQHDGPFEIWIAFYQPSLGQAHRVTTEYWVEAFNEQMRLMQKDPEKFKKRMELDKVETDKTEVK